jgi:hypothetical protein
MPKFEKRPQDINVVRPKNGETCSGQNVQWCLQWHSSRIRQVLRDCLIVSENYIENQFETTFNLSSILVKQIPNSKIQKF